MTLNPFRLSSLVDVERLELDFARRLERLLIDPRLGGRIRISSAYRSNAQQRDLYDAYLERGKRPPKVAVPGTSQHELGRAADLDRAIGAPAWELVHDVAAEYGLRFPVTGEPWHVESKYPPAPPQEDDDMPTPRELVDEFMARRIPTTIGIYDDEARSVTGDEAPTVATLIGWAFVELQRIARAVKR